MLKITAMISLMCILSTVWAASLVCDSCGSECASSCGTRRFRACCFNYLRKKRGPESLMLHTLDQNMNKNQMRSKLPVSVVENLPTPEQWVSDVIISENHPYILEDIVDNYLD